MAKPKRERATNNPIGKKINIVLSEKGMSGDYAALAKEFNVAVTSVYGWVEKGRIKKDRLPKLAAWSNKSLLWWLETAEDPLIAEGYELDRLENLRSFLDRLGVDIYDEGASQVLASMLDETFDYCEDLLNGKIPLGAPLARQIEKKLGIPKDELDQLPPALDLQGSSFFPPQDTATENTATAVTSNSVDPRDEPQGSDRFEYAFESLQLLLGRVGPLLEKSARATLHSWVDGNTSTAEATATLKALVAASTDYVKKPYNGGFTEAQQLKANG